MKIEVLFIMIACTIVLYGCGVVHDTPRNAFADGLYTGTIYNHTKSKVYAENIEDSIYIRPLLLGSRPLSIDTAIRLQVVLPKLLFAPPQQAVYMLRQTSFDIDLMTVPFKVRPTVRSVPAQFNTNLNGVVFLGYRSDFFRLRYQRNPLSHYNREMSHYGFSFGSFTGFGGTAVNPTVTENYSDREYDGVVWMKGLAAIIGVNNITIGLALGWDTLLDADRRHWIYQEKPWIGFAFGLNLN